MSDTTEPMPAFAAKADAREHVWETLRAERAARFPFPIRGRIPNFVGAERAAERLFEFEPWASARALKCNPDSPQRPVRELALRRGVVVYLPTPRLTGGFMRLDPARIPPDRLRDAATLSKAPSWADSVALDDLPALDAIVCGSVAVTERGERCGKGHGFADLENAILHELGHAPVPIATTVHDLQVVAAFPTEPSDVRLQLVVTPEAVYETGEPPRAVGLDGSRLDADALEAMPVVAETLRRRR